MPVYRVQGPDGKVYKIEGPAGATAGQLGEFILSQNIGAPPEETRPAVDPSVLDPNDARARREPQASGMQRFMASIPGRFLRGGLDTVDAGAQLLSRLGPAGEAERVDAINKDRAQKFDEAYRATGFGGADIARPLGSAALQIAALRGLTPAAATLPGKIAVGAGQGAVFGALQPVENTGEFWTEKAKQTALGGATGAIAAPVAEGISRIISPAAKVTTQALRAEGVRLTPGQMLGGLFKTAEEKAQSIPIVGASISAAKERGVEDLNRAALQRALSPVGEKLPKGLVGNEAVSFTRRTLSGKYNKILDEIGTLNIDDKVIGDFNEIGKALNNLPKDKADQFIRILKNEIADRVKGGQLTAESMKAAESNLGKQASFYRASQDYDVRKLGESLDAAVESLRGMVQRQAPQYAGELQAINKGWANLKRPQRAAASVAAEGGVFTPAQLHNAIKAMDRSKDKAAFAEGNALMQDLSAPAKKLMQDSVRNSGTADRAAAMGLLAALGNAPVRTLATLPLTIPPAMMYSRPGVAAMEALLASRPQIADPIAELVRRNSLALTAPAYPAINGLLYGGQ